MPRRIYWVAGLLVLLAGLAVMGQGYLLANRMRAVWEWPSVDGQIEESRVERRHIADSGYEYVPLVAYSYRVGGQDYRATRITYGRLGAPDVQVAEGLAATYPEGTPVEVFYDPMDPETAVLMRGNRTGLKALFIKGAVLAGIGITALVLYFVRRRRPPFGPGRTYK